MLYPFKPENAFKNSSFGKTKLRGLFLPVVGDPKKCVFDEENSF